MSQLMPTWRSTRHIAGDEMNGWRCPQCASTKVTQIGEVLTCLECGCQDYLYDYRNAYDNPLPITTTHPDIAELEDRICNLESISAERGSIPRRYYDEFKQIHGDIAALKSKVATKKMSPTPT